MKILKFLYWLYYTTLAFIPMWILSTLNYICQDVCDQYPEVSYFKWLRRDFAGYWKFSI